MNALIGAMIGLILLLGLGLVGAKLQLDEARDARDVYHERWTQTSDALLEETIKRKQLEVANSR